MWELSQLRKMAQGALASAAKTRNLVAAASLRRSANGLLETVAKLEKAKAEEEKPRQATQSLQDEQALEAEFNSTLIGWQSDCANHRPCSNLNQTSRLSPGPIDEGRRRCSSRRPYSSLAASAYSMACSSIIAQPSNQSVKAISSSPARAFHQGNCEPAKKRLLLINEGGAQ